MKKLFMLFSLLTVSSSSFALTQFAYFPEVSGKVAKINSERGVSVDDIDFEYIVSCAGHKTPSISGYDNGFILTDCNDDTLAYEIPVMSDGTFELPEINEFTLEGKAFSCYLIARAADYSTEAGFTLSQYIEVPCSKATNEEVKEAIEKLENLEITL